MKQKQKKNVATTDKKQTNFGKKSQRNFFSTQKLIGGGPRDFSPVTVPDAGPSPDEAFERARPLLRVQQLLQGL